MKYTVASKEDVSRVSFNCGSKVIDDYFREKALHDSDAVTYCFWTDEDQSKLVGIASLSCSGIIIRSSDQFNLTPAVELKIFAVDEEFQHQPVPDDEDENHWSDYCLYYLLEIVDELRCLCGFSHLVLYSVPDAVNFYSRHGFHSFISQMEMPSNLFISGCTPMFMNL